jgi:carboxypeptidase Taq
MATEAPATSVDDAYARFEEKVERIGNLSHVQRQLNWDQEVVMPEGGTPARSQQLSTVSALSHELLTDDEMADLLDELEAADLNDERAAVVREVRRKHDRATSVPTDLVQEISRTTSEAHPKWKQAKEQDDFSVFAPVLEELVDLKRQYAEHIDPDRDPYAVLFEEYEPYLDVETAERVLQRLRDELVPLIDDIRASDVDLSLDALDGEFDADTQEALTRDVLDELGYDWEHGRLDTAPHPFSSGNQFDARVTTRFDESNLLGGFMATVHEFGHASYTQGLPDEHYGTPLGEARDLSVHESQSRLWENHVGRSRAFWERFLPTVAERFPAFEDLTAREAYEAANQVYEDNLVRVEADELTYHMHIVVRFEVEKALLRGEVDVDDVPELWNDKYEEYLGIRPETDAEGCLQDIHWSHGSFGYFPTYSLGSVMAAQLYAAAEEELGSEAQRASETPSGDEPRGSLDERIENGEFDDLHEWLTENVHRHGCRYTTDDLVEEATGEAFTADYFLDYAKEKYGDLYDL